MGVLKICRAFKVIQNCKGFNMVGQLFFVEGNLPHQVQNRSNFPPSLILLLGLAERLGRGKAPEEDSRCFHKLD